MNGYMGKLLRVDMTHQRITEEPLDEGMLRQYLGGSGLAAKILMESSWKKQMPIPIPCPMITFSFL
jgi:aldehyde:ferredoxin oxidoreductase